MAYRAWITRGTRDRGQTSLELTAALILVVILLVASVRIFLWLNEGIVNQQVGYERTRVSAGAQSVATGSVVLTDGSTLGGYNAPRIETLNVFQ